MMNDDPGCTLRLLREPKAVLLEFCSITVDIHSDIQLLCLYISVCEKR